jgi:uncharacterized protein (DUF433 family)
MPQIERITIDRLVMGGAPCIRNMRVTVGTIVGLFTAGRSEHEILEAYPCLEPEDLRAALAYRGDYSAERDNILGNRPVDGLMDEIERRRKLPPAK